MKKLLGVIGILALAAALLPAQGYADLRGSFAPITIASGFVNGCEQPATRWSDPVADPDGNLLTVVDGRLVEGWFSFSTRSLVPGRESVRSIWLHWNQQQSGYFAPLLYDPAANTSWFDPAWSYDGRFMAYVQTDADGFNQKMYVQEYTNAGDFHVPDDPSTPEDEFVPGLDTPIGAPILVIGTGRPRHPNWSPTGHTMAFDWDDAGSIDLYTINMDMDGNGTLGDMGAPVRRTFLDVKGEQTPTWHPNGHDIAYSTNRFGPNIIEIIDLNLPSGDPGYTRLAEPNFTFVSHSNPDFDGDGQELWYDAPSGEDASLPASLWKLNLATQAKCEIQFDVRTDSDPDVSNRRQDAQSGALILPYYYVLYSTQAANFGLNVWRTNPINSCTTPLPMGVNLDPTTLNLGSGGNITMTIQFPAETKALGYVCRSGNVGGEGVRCRGSLFGGPTLAGIMPSQNGTAPGSAALVSNSNCEDQIAPNGERQIECWYSRREITEQMNALGLVDQVVPVEARAYSNLTGRPFRGFGYLKVTGSFKEAATLLRNSPNPFNPVTKIEFAVGKAGRYSVKIFNVRGELVRTLSNQHYDVGTHEATWDGRTTGGGKAASGVYLAKIVGKDVSEGGALRLVLAK